MKILGIMGSSRRDGNTNDLLDVVLKSASAGGAETEKIVLLDFEIKHILNCKDCLSTGRCLNDDDFPALMEKIFAANVLVYASPLYWFTISGLLKVLLDRYSCWLYRDIEYFQRRMRGKGAVVVCTKEEPEKPETAGGLLECMRRTIEYCEQVHLGVVVGPGGSRGTVLKDVDAVAQAMKLGAMAAAFAAPVAVAPG